MRRLDGLSTFSRAHGGLLGSILLAGCNGHEMPRDGGVDAPDVDAHCAFSPWACGPPLPDRPVTLTLDGVPVPYRTPQVSVSHAFAQYTSIYFFPPEGTCGPSMYVRRDGDPRELGPLPAWLFLEGEGSTEIVGTVDVTRYDETAWRGHLDVAHPRVRIDLDLELPICGDASGP